MAMCAFLLAPHATATQQAGKVYRVAGVGAGPETCEFPASSIEKGTPWEGRRLQRYEIVLRLALRDLGLVDGQNLAFERRCFQEHAQLDGIMAELATRNLDAAVGFGPSPALALKQALRVPIVFINVGDPVRDGLVESIQRPGGNMTGVANLANLGVIEKRWQINRELLPQATTAAVIFIRADESLVLPPGDRPWPPERFGFDVWPVPVDGWSDIEAAILGMRARRPDVLAVSFSGPMGAHAPGLFRLAIAEGIPVLCNLTHYVEQGCLMSYSADFGEQMRQGARMLARILQGANPAEMPVELGTRYELWLNLNTAKSLGLTIPPSILQRADRVIE